MRIKLKYLKPLGVYVGKESIDVCCGAGDNPTGQLLRRPSTPPKAAFLYHKSFSGLERSVFSVFSWKDAGIGKQREWNWNADSPLPSL